MLQQGLGEEGEEEDEQEEVWLSVWSAPVMLRTIGANEVKRGLNYSDKLLPFG